MASERSFLLSKTENQLIQLPGQERKEAFMLLSNAFLTYLKKKRVSKKNTRSILLSAIIAGHCDAPEELRTVLSEEEKNAAHEALAEYFDEKTDFDKMIAQINPDEAGACLNEQIEKLGGEFTYLFAVFALSFGYLDNDCGPEVGYAISSTLGYTFMRYVADHGDKIDEILSARGDVLEITSAGRKRAKKEFEDHSESSKKVKTEKEVPKSEKEKPEKESLKPEKLKSQKESEMKPGKDSEKNKRSKEELEASLQKIETKIAKLSEEIDKLSNSSMTTKTKIKTIELMVAGNSSVKEAEEKEKKIFQSRYEAALAEMKKLDEDILEIRTRQRENELLSENSEDDLIKRRDEFEKKRDEVYKQSYAKTKELQDTISSLSSRRHNLVYQIQQSEKELEKVFAFNFKRKKELTTQIEQMEKEVEENRAKSDEAKAELAGEEARKNALIDELETSITSLEQLLMNTELIGRNDSRALSDAIKKQEYLENRILDMEKKLAKFHDHFLLEHYSEGVTGHELLIEEKKKELNEKLSEKHNLELLLKNY